MDSAYPDSKWLGIANNIAQIVGWLDRDLFRIDAPMLLNGVADRVGLDDYGDIRFREGLDALAESVNIASGLSPVGRLMIKATLKRYLTNRLLIQDRLRQHPEIHEEKIHRPLFIAGLNRTGTTFLHNLLALAPEARAPRTWELMRPVPRKYSGSNGGQGRVREAKRLLWFMNLLAPEMEIIHPIKATDVEECYPLINHAFTSPAFTMHYGLPGYADWLEKLTPEIENWVYREYQSQLQILQAGSPQVRWILKSAVHLYFLRTVLEGFPDAAVVQTHRNPLQMVPSLCSMVYSFRRIIYSRVSRESLGRESMIQIENALKRGLAARAEIDSRRILDIEFKDLVTDPIGQVRRIHEYFNLGSEKAHENDMRKWLAANPPSSRGKHQYNLAQFGLDEDMIMNRLELLGVNRANCDDPIRQTRIGATS